jgi:DedD protein
MATLHDRDRDISEYRERERKAEDREISLGTGTILGIFFCLALLCAIFFGFGYSMGRKSVQTALAAAAPQSANSASLNDAFSNFKPSAGGSPAHTSPAANTDAADDNSSLPRDPDAEMVTAPVNPTGATPAPIRSGAHASPAKPTTDGTAASQSAAIGMPAISPSGTAMVQVAAVSHQEDADTLIAALKKKGYSVFIRQEPQDHLLHIQIGPFATHKDADSMRLHLLADGYNAIVK